MRASQHRSTAVRLGILTVAALIAACAHDTPTQSAPSGSTMHQFAATNLRATADFVPGCNDCNPWIPIAPSLPGNSGSQPSLGLAMSGPSSQRPNLTCTFGAIVNSDGATPPYDYEWTDGRQDGYMQSYTHNGIGAGTTYTVTLTVTDANGRTGTISRTVNVGSQYGNC